MKPFHVYMLVCADQSYYVGHTDDLEQRLSDHAEGTFGGYTSTRRPVRLVWCQETTTRDEALIAERHIKRWTRAKKEALIRGDWGAISQLARGKDWTERPGAVRPSTTARLRRAYAQDERVGEASGSVDGDGTR
ncbi:MAG: GIY-YIG nuclease family protein [Anaeromyxobacter sp.]